MADLFEKKPQAPEAVPKPSGAPTARYEEVLLSEAREKRLNGNFSAAIAAFEEFLLRYGSLIEDTQRSIIHAEVAELHFFRGDYGTARTHCEKARNFRDLNDQANILLGKIAVAEYRFDQARGYFSYVPESHPGRWLGMALIAIKLRKTVDAQRALAKAAENISPDFPEYVVLSAYAMLLSGKTDEAVSICRAAVHHLNKDVFLLLLCAELLMTAGHFGEAVAVADTVRQYSPDHDQVNAIRAHGAYAKENFEDARAFAQEAVRRNPRNAYANTILMKCAVRRGEYEQAEYIGRSILRDVPDYTLGHANLGDIYFAQEQYDLAEIEYGQIGELMDATTKGARLRQARAAFIDGEFEHAAHLLEKLIEEVHAYYDDAMCDLVLCYDKLGKDDEKEKILDKMQFRKTFYKRTEDILKMFGEEG